MNIRIGILCIALTLVSEQAFAKGWHFTRPPEPDCYQETCSDSVKKEMAQTLAKRCVQEAGRANGNTTVWKDLVSKLKHVPDSQAEHMKALCAQMATAYVSPDKRQHQLQAQQCSDQIEEEITKGPDNPPHFKRLQQLCQKLTGQPVTIK